MNELRKIKKANYIKILKTDGEKFNGFLKQKAKGKSIIEYGLKVLYEGDYILFPLNSENFFFKEFLKMIQETIPYQIVIRNTILNPKYTFKTLQEGLKDVFTTKFLKYIPKSYDIIGSIIIIEYDRIDQVPQAKHQFFKEQIAKKLIEKHKNADTVYEKVGKVKGKYRLRDLSLVWGKENSETLYKENDCIFNLDVRKVYFSPRLNHERKRIASKEYFNNELIVDMFTGVGPFSIEIARYNDVIIHAFDVNPHSYHYLVDNIERNNLKGQIIPYYLDVRELTSKYSEIGQKLKHSADRIIMNLPESSLDFIDVACFLIRDGGILYNYQICEKPRPINRAIQNLRTALEINKFRINKVNEKRIVKQFSPKADLVVLDLSINSNL